MRLRMPQRNPCVALTTALAVDLSRTDSGGANPGEMAGATFGCETARQNLVLKPIR